ncbi:Tfp pilus assembly protein PilN [Hahella chejuensis KCTC 2396]|uniref:Tfp pilus assembly protein PilN n=1 Tax=Hahella chejuensis (strain KCTC 2396) TaxID=349521 RepID=Q2S9Q1_HAHCH|nr:PilN domain-containing protein [Hahella chejuensis]ABC32623.1 Tfp pilus assembly protein PilN [Hahella chejuensis KCTC 2396]
MARINLRPWREELRAERQKQFITVLLGMLIISAGAGFLWHRYVEGAIEYQVQRNNYVRNEIAQLEKQIKEIRELKKKRDALIERMKVIQDLQGKRPIIVRVFDELVKTNPDGVYFTNLVKKGETLEIKGVGESNSRISSLMRRLDESDWFKEPNLTSVKALRDGESKSTFNMTVKQEAPKEESRKGGA